MPLLPPAWRLAAALFLLPATGCGPQAPATAPRPDSAPRAEAFLDTLQRRTFDFFWERSDPATGLTPDRWPSESFSSIAAVGYALTAYGIGVEERYVSRAEAAGRVLATLKWFWQAPQGPAAAGVSGYQGFFYHFLDMQQGHRFRDVELSTIDTSLLLAGVLFCQSYFDQPTPVEADIRALADSLYRRTNWQWAQRTPPLVNMGWKPEQGWEPYDWHGFNEAMLLYILALGSPTFPLDSTAWSKWTSTYQWGTFFDQPHVGFAPLFGHHYSHVWIDFRRIQDPYMKARGIDYFENSRRATLSQRSYAIANPHGWADYGADIWGLSASDGPADVTLEYKGSQRRFFTYAARGAAFNEVRDDGTIAPTAAAGSLPFAPEIVIPALLAMRAKYGDHLFGQYGFLDAFNPSFTFDTPVTQGKKVPGLGWFDTDYLGIDQGPIVAMIANYRKDLVWKTMRKNRYIVTGLTRAGFTGGWLAR
jgi:hypothetical protein